MATTIANLTVKQDGSLEGMLATLNVNVPIAILPNASKANDDAPDFRVIARRNGFELGAGLEPHLEADRRGVHLGQAFGPGDRRHLRQRRPRAWQRSPPRR